MSLARKQRTSLAWVAEEHSKGPGLERNDKSAQQFTALFREHESLVRSVIFQITGDGMLNDLVQESFIRIWKGLPEFRQDARLTSWIYRVSVNVALDSLRSRSRQNFFSDVDVTSLPSKQHSSEQDLANRQLVEVGLSRLSEEHRAVIVLALIHERPLSEVAEILEISEGTVKSRLHYAKDQFRRFLQEKGVKP